jgi:hypothetical protein
MNGKLWFLGWAGLDHHPPSVRFQQKALSAKVSSVAATAARPGEEHGEGFLMWRRLVTDRRSAPRHRPNSAL